MSQLPMSNRRSACVLSLLSISFIAVTGEVAHAFPPFAVNNGNSCSTNCHGSSGANGSIRPDAIELLGDGLLNLDDENLPGATDRGELPFFTARPGETVTLNGNVLDGTEEYALQIKRFETEAVLSDSNNTLADFATPDPAYNGHGPPPSTYYATDVTPWIGSTTPFLFNLTLDPGTPLDVYDLEFAIAGHDHDTDQLFYNDQHFYLQVVSVMGDYNGNLTVEQADLDLVLLNWGNTLDDPRALGWTNDLPIGTIDQEELDKVLLNWGSTIAAVGTASVPEPGTAALGLLMLVLVAWRWRRL